MTEIKPQNARRPAAAVILVNPQLGENIGTAARAMANFGLDELRLVNPRDGWPSDKALRRRGRGEPGDRRARVHADCPGPSPISTSSMPPRRGRAT
jgi:tRNA/rRNA methyltransferase